ncbi:E3 ubiquitin-protein ligase MBR1 [Raphanus sativus]|nr:E3 ubiquitin-protein ligase MBR1 [Raphanus sativus]
MQGQQSTGGSSTELNQGDNESVYSAESTMMNPVTSTPPGRPAYASPAQNHNWWRLGEPSTVSGPSGGQVEIKTNQDGRQLGSNGMVHAAGYIRHGPSFLRGSSSNAMPQHANMSMDMDSDGYGAVAQSSGLAFRHGSSVQKGS